MLRSQTNLRVTCSTLRSDIYSLPSNSKSSCMLVSPSSIDESSVLRFLMTSNPSKSLPSSIDESSILRFLMTLIADT